MDITKVNQNTLKLYGVLVSGDGDDIVRLIEEMSQGESEITIHIHSPGGSVVDGNLILNSIAKSKSKFHVIIDGVAASMASIIMCAADTISIVENGKIMIHAPQSIAFTSKEMEKRAKLLNRIEDYFVKTLVSRTGKSETDVRAWFDNGDTWFTAQDAKQNGLVDKIIETVLPTDAIASLEGLPLTALCKKFETINQSKDNMSTTPTLSINALSTLGLEATATGTQVEQAITTLSKENAGYKAQIEAHNTEKCETLVNKAIEEGRISATDKQHYVKLAQTDYDLAKNTLTKMPPAKDLSKEVKSGGTTATDRSEWTFDDWQKKDPQGLFKLGINDPETYAELIKPLNQ